MTHGKNARRHRVNLMAICDTAAIMARRRERAEAHDDAALAAAVLTVGMLTMWRVGEAASAEFCRLLMSLAGGR